MKGRRRFWLVLILFCCLLAIPAGLAAAADDFLPPKPPHSVTWSKPPLYDRYPVWNYVYGGRIQGSDTYYRLYYLMNMVQVGKAWYMLLGIRSVEYALRFDAVTGPVQAAGTAMNGLVQGLWTENGGLVTAGLAAAAAFALWLWALRGQHERALRLLGGTAVLLVGSYAIFAAAPGTLVTSAGIARALGGQAFTAMAAVTAPNGTESTAQERLLRSGGETAWRVFVYQPWVEGEFSPGAPEKDAYKDADLPGGKWLALAPSERNRRYTVMAPGTQTLDFREWDQTLAQDYLPRRLMLALVSGLVGFAYGTALLILAGGVLFYQLLLLAMLSLAPLWLLLALWHPAGVRIARGAVVKAVGALVAQVVLLIVLAVWLAMTGPLAALGSGLGWLAQAILLALFGVVLCRYRFAWLNWGRAPAPAGAERAPGRSALWPEWAFRWREAARAARTTARPPQTEGETPALLPQFPEAGRAPAPLGPGRWPDESLAEIPPAVLELTVEMRRMRSRFGSATGAPEQRSELGPAEESRRMAATAEAGRGAPRAVETPVPPAPRVRPEQGQVIDRYRGQ